MGAQALSSRAIVGMYYERLEAQAGLGWIDRVANYFTSDQASETYPWLTMVPALREWIGGRNVKSLTSQEIEIINIDYEATIEILLKHLRRDKTPQLQTRINELITRGNTHWAALLSTLVISG